LNHHQEAKPTQLHYIDIYINLFLTSISKEIFQTIERPQMNKKDSIRASQVQKSTELNLMGTAF